MIMQPQEFLSLSQKKGFSNSVFKQAMCHATENIFSIKVAQVQGMQLYFILSENQQGIGCTLVTPAAVHESEQIFTDAFGLLKIIAD